MFHKAVITALKSTLNLLNCSSPPLAKLLLAPRNARGHYVHVLMTHTHTHTTNVVVEFVWNVNKMQPNQLKTHKNLQSCCFSCRDWKHNNLQHEPVDVVIACVCVCLVHKAHLSETLGSVTCYQPFIGRSVCLLVNRQAVTVFKNSLIFFNNLIILVIYKLQSLWYCRWNISRSDRFETVITIFNKETFLNGCSFIFLCFPKVCRIQPVSAAAHDLT